MQITAEVSKISKIAQCDVTFISVAFAKKNVSSLKWNGLTVFFENEAPLLCVAMQECARGFAARI